jgi:hypothetical protein
MYRFRDKFVIRRAAQWFVWFVYDYGITTERETLRNTREPLSKYRYHTVLYKYKYLWW